MYLLSRERVFTLLLQLFSALSLVSCLTPVSIDLEQQGNVFVISGQVSTLPGRTFVNVGVTNGDSRLPTGYPTAYVAVIDETGNVFELTHTAEQRKEGTYILNVASAVAGRTYHIRVETPEGVFESKPERVPLQTGEDELSYDFSVETEVDGEGVPFTNNLVNVYSSSTIPAGGDNPLFVKWYLEEVYMIVPTDFPDVFGIVPPNCFVTQEADPQRIVLFDGSRYTTDVTQKNLLAKRVIDQSFHTRHYFVSYFGSITAEAHDYWKQVNILTNQVGSIFDAPPSPIQGNMIDINNPGKLVHGYFQATNESLKRISLVSFDLPITLSLYCEYTGEFRTDRYPRECINCTDAWNSSYTRPSWFGE